MRHSLSMLGFCVLAACGSSDSGNDEGTGRTMLTCPAAGLCDAGADDVCDEAADFCRHGMCSGDHDRDGATDCEFTPPRKDDDTSCCECADEDGDACEPQHENFD